MTQSIDSEHSISRGRCDGDVRVQHQITIGTVSVTGDTFEAVLEEVKRRAGWAAAHDVKPLAAPDDIPF